ncbi:polyprenyl synthetase family protein [Aneurinibacillus thermoaerophilus]|uniref:Farnesyl diphosphate synthase n=2 Tax=Aneurinibacillus thermoaerophilus TaxID=143495 RepID=A0A1G7W518_ANETH|nr:polyprenyl synthetase [Aneurinibacillus sp. XH2]SDG67095.1 geranylgeranyl diphosphate synthase, type II [Aneurinibacillus thermoaerophilus]
MNQALLHDYMKTKADLVGKRLADLIETPEIPETLRQAMAYSLLAGGKRLRPVLVLATLEAFGKSIDAGIPVACAVEMVHTYSLIHDDLPAMDNDDFRRGKPTNHKVYGEATAILAGDALLTYAFETVCSAEEAGAPSGRVLRIVRELASYAGPRGMVGGQSADMEGEDIPLTPEQLRYIHQHKTADLLVFCVRAGAILAGASERQLSLLTRYANNIGLAFQIQDDILDVTGDETKMGKPVGSDEKRKKSTYPALIGMEKSRSLLKQLIEEANLALVEAALEDNSILRALAAFIIERDY